MLVAVFTFGVGLLAVAFLWDRIQEFGIVGVTIWLIETAVESQNIALIDTVGDYVKEPDSTTATTIAEQVYRMSTDKPRLALVNLRSGDLWVPANLSLYMLLLANRSSVEVVVFIHQIDSGPRTYLGSASVTLLANVLSARDRALSNAYHATEAIPLVNPLVVGPSLGEEFFKKLSPQGPTQEQKND